MNPKYLLPCPCGRETVIEVTQSGQTVTCQCGRELDVPSMLQIRKLPRALVEAREAPRRAWGARERLLVLGGLVLAVAVGCAAVLLARWPAAPKVPDTVTWVLFPTGGDKTPVFKETRDLTPLESYVVWNALPRELEASPQGPRETYNRAVASARNWMIVVGVVALLGAACAAGSLLAPPAGARRGRRKR